MEDIFHILIAISGDMSFYLYPKLGNPSLFHYNNFVQETKLLPAKALMRAEVKYICTMGEETEDKLFPTETRIFRLDGVSRMFLWVGDFPSQIMIIKMLEYPGK